MEDRPLLGIPVLRPEEPLERLVRSVDGEARLLIVDNSEGAIDFDYLPDDAWVTQPYANLGVAASWNEIMRSALLTDPYVLIANADTELSPGDIRYLVEEMEKGNPRWVGIAGDWRLMGLTAECVEQVGWYDPSFHPIYLEDCDYEHRCNVAGVPHYNHFRTGSMHGSGLSWKGSALEAENTRTYPQNAAHYKRKWGGGWRGGETFDTPFDSGTPDKCGPDLSRLREQSWRL